MAMLQPKWPRPQAREDQTKSSLISQNRERPFLERKRMGIDLYSSSIPQVPCEGLVGKRFAKN